MSAGKMKPTFFVVGMALVSLVVGLVFPEGYDNRNRSPNFIHVLELAELIRDREAFQLIDLRSPEAFKEFHIPTARNLSIQQLNSYPFEGKVIFYSENDLLTRRLWGLLSDEERLNSAILYGGIQDWYHRLLYPKLPYGDHVQDPELLQRIHELCKFYGGFADFKNDPDLLDYYQLDMKNALWPQHHKGGKLVRKGC